MECSWDEALLARGDQLPADLLETIRSGSHEQYLDSITGATLDPSYTYTLFSHCENIFAHVCASLRDHGSLASATATLGRIIPFAPYLSTHAEQLLAAERYQFSRHDMELDDTLYLLGLFRLCSSDWRTFRSHVDPTAISQLLRSPSRPIVYLSIRILQLYLQGSDHWFESMVKQHLGEDSPESAIEGIWDDITIDYRFLTLWEHERHDRVRDLVADVTQRAQHSVPEKHRRTIPHDSFHSSVAVVGGIALPRERVSRQGKTPTRLVETPAISRNLKAIAGGLKHLEPILLTGLAGSGKSMLIRHLATTLGKHEKMVTLHLNEQSDAKLLIGVYTTGEKPGSFVWKPGVLTTAVREGRWIVIEDLDRAPNEVIGALLPLIERGELFIPSRKQTIKAAQGFRIIATIRTTTNHRGHESSPLSQMLGARLWRSIRIEMPPLIEQREVAETLFPSLSSLLPQFIDAFERLQTTQARPNARNQSKAGTPRTISPRDLMKWCRRTVNCHQDRKSFTSHDVDNILLEAVDCFLGALSDGPAKHDMAALIAEVLHIDPQRRDYLLMERDAQYGIDKTTITAGRYSLQRASHAKKTVSQDSTFSTNPHTSRMLERVAAAVLNREPLLLVGETGVGKTTAVQHLARHLGKKLVPFNLSQQSEAGDLLGGFKPVNARSLIVPMQDEFDDLFTASFSKSKNQDFLDLLGKQLARSNWKAVCKLWQRALKMVEQQLSPSTSSQGEAPSKKRKVESKRTKAFERWAAFSAKVTDMENRLAHGTEAFAFSFVEGGIVKAVRNGDWILLDEINLAAMDTLESIADLLDPSSPSILLTEAGEVEKIDAHPDFRVFAAMNPATDVGKKDLTPGIRSRFTELYVESPDKDIRSLQGIVRSYLRHESATDQAIPLDVSSLYRKIAALSEQNRLVDGAGQRPHFSLRTLTRTLSYAKHIAPLCSLRRALFEGFQMSFLTFLDLESSRLVHPLLEQHLFGKRTNVRAELQKALRKPTDGRDYVLGWPGSKHWVRQGQLPLEDQSHYILTPFIRNNIENLVRAASTRQFPVLVQGPTSSGKTSMIEYLAKRTGHKFVRINNHEHTDLQEYLGTYVSGADGKLQFQEGILVKALREGHWIVLDELNLAPTDVLEALNRLLDDNRELLIPETQEVVRPHEDFMLFATQNPAGLYGGRKTLSRAFRNRFLELHFDDIPIDELQEILHRRTQLPESRCKRIVAVYRELSVLRQESRLFEQKSFATLRDLFRWALRPNDTIEQLAVNGFMLLAERVRKPEERQVIKEVIEKAMSAKGPRVSVDEGFLYARDCQDIQSYQQSTASQDVVWTKAMRRLYVLVSRAMANEEPVLLIGETGCGKTTVCQMLADAFGKQLHTVNAHQNTETGDLIGSQRPIRNRAVIEAGLRQQLLASTLLESRSGASDVPTNRLLDAYDHALSMLSAADQAALSQAPEHACIQASRVRFHTLFEWADGSLVRAMKDGAFFLLDEISLADDSVLERLNSVLESERSILLAEKGSLDSFVQAKPGFQFFATMNPGGDYGKRELSPALRNRFTEIWVPSLNDTEDVAEIVTAKLFESARPFASVIVAFATWFKEQYNTSASSSVSIRDALAWVDFINSKPMPDLQAAVVHGAAMVYIDTIGANPAGLMTMTRHSPEEERDACLTELGRLLHSDVKLVYGARTEIRSAEDHLLAGRFSIAKRSSGPTADLGFSFDPPTTKTNAMRIIRALQLPKPVMLEGNPGVGKTALITAIAEAVSAPLTRINLSEQTDLIDLFGSDVPVEGTETGSFTWRDAPFLRAMKHGEWVLLDEMNLASQSVLEGLNACLDHRGEVYIPELGQTFTRHPAFRLFAAQNPHHQGGGRKGLPASFVNRFTVVYADAFKPDDLLLICRRRFPHLDDGLITNAVDFVGKLEQEVTRHKRFGANGGPWEFNLRDVSRWLALASSDRGLLKAGTANDFVAFLFSQRFRTSSDRAVVAEIFGSVFNDPSPRSDLFPSISTQAVQLGLGLLPRNSAEAPCLPSLVRKADSAQHPRVIESVMLCIQQSWPVILTGSSGSGKTAVIEQLASVVGAPMVSIAMNAETDAMDLVGGFEQYDPQRSSLQTIEDLRGMLLAEIRNALVGDRDATLADLLRLSETVDQVVSSEQLDLEPLVQELHSLGPSNASDVLERLQTASADVDKARFEWIDGVLVDALQKGKWLVLDNANLCSSSVLDRLNSLLEPNGSLIINEHSTHDGAARIIHPHPSFRIFLLLDPRYGELSRAMRNRAVELHLSKIEGTCSPAFSDPLFSESAVARLRNFKALASSDQSHATESAAMVIDHLAASDQSLVARFKRQLEIGLHGGQKDLRIPDAAMHPELIARAHSFSGNLISQLQGPADFANVQTLHPLNNQPLICTSPHTLSHASTLAAMFDLQVDVASMHQLLNTLQSNPSLIKRLRRAEQRWELHQSSDSRNSKSSRMLTMLQQILVCFASWVKSSAAIPAHALQSARLLIDYTCVVWRALHDAVASGQVDQAKITSLLTIADKAVGDGTYSEQDVLSALLSQLSTIFRQLLHPSREAQGIGCTAVWQAMRPTTPSTMAQLQELLQFEALVDRFDALSQTSRMSLEEAAELRLQLAQALGVAKHGGRDLAALIEKLQGLGLRFEEDVDADAGLSKSSHFLSTFQQLLARLAGTKGAVTIERLDLAKLEISAHNTTVKSQFCLEDQQRAVLAQRCCHDLGSAEAAANSKDTLFTLISSADQVPLGQLDSFTAQTRLLGKAVSSQAHKLSGPELVGLDRSLATAFSEVLTALQGSQDSHLTAMASKIVSQNVSTSNNAVMTDPTSSDWIGETLCYVSAYLSHAAYEPSQALALAASAWTSFALAALHLYVPGQTFDPALEPLFRLELHKRQDRGLRNKLEALRTFRQALVGEADSMRARIIEEDLNALGPEPQATIVCRPEVSELSKLQSEFDALMRTLEPLRMSFQPAETVEPVDATTLANLGRMRDRLEKQYRAYDDLTDPVVFFIDCLLTGNDLATQSKAAVGSKQSLASITPLVDASPDTWLEDGVFLHVAQASSNAQDEIDWLQAIALRCRVFPLEKCSTGLRDRVDLGFQRLHTLWKAELSEDQKKSAAKSSLYKFKGNDDAETEPSVADLEELFPSGDAADNTGAPDLPAAPMQGHAPTIAKLHALIHGAPASDPQDALGLLRHWISRSSSEPLKGPSGHLLPATIFGLGELNDSVCANPQPRSKYNMYADSNVVECAKLFRLLHRIELRFTELQKAWPEHATPEDVLLVCSQISSLPHSAPLPRFFPLLEKLHATVTEWQKIASREYSAASLLDDLTNTIIAWRQLELSAWAGVLNREWHQCESTASSWWFVAYDSIVAAVDGVDVPESESRRHVEGLLATLSGFISASGLGEFAARLRLLRGFEAELASTEQGDSLKCILHAALQNFVAFYTHFEKAVSHALDKGRSDLDKEAKKIIQLASWKDRNIDVLRQSAQSSHRKLLKLIKKYRALLAQPVTTILQNGLPATVSANGSPVLKMATVEGRLPAGIDDDTGLNVWDQRANRFRHATRTAGLMQSKTLALVESFTGQKQLQDFTAQLDNDIASLQKATPSLLTEENKTLVNHLKTRKRRLFADILKEVRAMGFQASLSTQALSVQESTDRVLSQLPKLPQLAAKSGVNSNTHELHRLLDIMPTTRQSARSHSDDLTPAEISRSMVLLESMLQQSVLQYCNFNAHLSAALSMQTLIEMLGSVGTAKGLTHCQSHPIEVIAGSLDSIGAVLPACIQVLQHQSSMSGYEYSKLASSLWDCERQTQELRFKLDVLPTLPIGLESQDHILVQAEHENLKQGINNIVEAATGRHPEIEPVTAQLLRWTTSTATVATQSSVNGYCVTDMESWTARLFDLADQMLISMQDLDKNKAASLSENAWLLEEQCRLNDALQSLRVPSVCSSLQQVLADLSHVQDNQALEQTIHMSRSVLPIVQSYATAVQGVVIAQSNMHVETAKTAFKLAQSFTTLCQKGFCTPSDKSQDNDSSEGNVESGTGLGDGEGAEDISKDIAPDEDLSELAQEVKRENAGEEIQEEKDAVDMADEDFEGEAGDSGEQQDGEDGEGPEDDAEGQGDMDEESGEVDDQGPGTVDEKMWDSGKDESRRDKETDEAAGERNEDNVTAGKEDAKDAGGEEDEQAEEGDEAGAETEDVQRDVADQMDPHTREDENLDLPEDMNMDQQKDAEDESDLQSLSNMDESMSEVGPDPQQEEAVADDNEANEEGDPNGEAQNGEDAADQDGSSDVLLTNDEQQNANEDPQKDTAAPPEAGNGPDQSESNEEGAAQAKSPDHQSGDTQTERDAEGNASEDQEASGAGAEGEAPRSQEDHAQQERLPFKQIGDALHEWYNQNADIEKARQPDQTKEVGDTAPQPAPTDFEHLPNEDAQADAQALGTASAEDSMALDKDQALPVNDDKKPEHLLFQETPEEPAEDPDANQAEGAQLEPSDRLRPETSSNAFVGEPQDGNVDMPDGPEKSDEDDVDDVDQQLLQTHISHDQAADGITIDEARTQWAAHEESTRNLALMLTEHLRLILQPTQATKMRGDFRTGKRLNIKRIIPYIASSYKRDKIWMRRSVPSKRAYQIMLAIDDSQSMMESESRHLAFETLAMVTKSLSMLEVGELSVVGFGEEVKVAHDFSSPFTSDAGAEIFKRLSFAQNKTNVRKLLAESIEMFRSARLKASSSASDLWQLQLIVSDGICEDHPLIRQLVRQAHEERIMVVFIVVDAAAQSKASEAGTKQSILDLQTAEFAKDASGEMQLKMVKYLDTFPFGYYLIVRDIQELPGVLAGALRQWFSEVVETNS